MQPNLTKLMALAECRVANKLIRSMVLMNHELNAIRLDIAMRLGDLEQRMESEVEKDSK